MNQYIMISTMRFLIILSCIIYMVYSDISDNVNTYIMESPRSDDTISEFRHRNKDTNNIERDTVLPSIEEHDADNSYCYNWYISFNTTWSATIITDTLSFTGTNYNIYYHAYISSTPCYDYCTSTSYKSLLWNKYGYVYWNVNNVPVN